MSNIAWTWREVALQGYVRERMTPKQFAEYVGAPYSSAVHILSGNRWKETPRPAGFAYPWPEKAPHSDSIRNAYSRPEIEEALALRHAKGWSYRELAEHMGVQQSTAHRWENGDAKRRKKEKA
jgi:transposase